MDPNNSTTILILILGSLLFFQRIVIFEDSLLFMCVTLVIWSDVISCRKVFVDCIVICRTCLFEQRLLFYCYTINIYTKTTFYSQPIKMSFLLFLKINTCEKFYVFIYLFI